MRGRIRVSASSSALVQQLAAIWQNSPAHIPRSGSTWRNAIGRDAGGRWLAGRSISASWSGGAERGLCLSPYLQDRLGVVAAPPSHRLAGGARSLSPSQLSRRGFRLRWRPHSRRSAAVGAIAVARAAAQAAGAGALVRGGPARWFAAFRARGSAGRRCAPLADALGLVFLRLEDRGRCVTSICACGSTGAGPADAKAGCGAARGMIRFLHLRMHPAYLFFFRKGSTRT